MRKLGIKIILLSIILVLFSFNNCQKKCIEADIILSNGIIFTVNQLQPQVSHLAILGDRILAVGDSASIFAFKGLRTQVINLKGHFVCPGFNDAHLHIRSGIKSMIESDLSSFKTMRELQRFIRRIANKMVDEEPNTWLIGRGWDQNKFFEGKWPTKRYLDVVTPYPFPPMLLKRVCGHAVWVNSKALSIAGIDKETPDPPGGEIMRDARTGEPTGILKDEAIQLVTQYIPQKENQDFEFLLDQFFNDMLACGITSVQDQSEPHLLEFLYQKYKENRLNCRVSEWLPLQNNIENCIRLNKQYNNNWTHVGLLKGFMDGSLGARSAYLKSPYADAPQTSGLMQHPIEMIQPLVIQADKQGFQVGIHAIGDMANKLVLDFYETAQKMNGNNNLRHRIEHAQILDPKDIPRFGSLGIVASMQPYHCVEDMPWVEKRIGRSRSRYAYAWHSLKQNGTVLAFGSDWPVVPYNPFLGIYAAVTRSDTTGYPTGGWIHEERLTVEDAIEAYTLGSAYAEHMEKEKGSLESGKLADIIVLNKNLLEVESHEILKTKVLTTIVGGKIVYQRNQSQVVSENN